MYTIPVDVTEFKITELGNTRLLCLCAKRPLRVRRPFAVILLLVLPSAGLGVYYMCISAVGLDVLLRKNEFLCDRNCFDSGLY